MTSKCFVYGPGSSPSPNSGFSTDCVFFGSKRGDRGGWFLGFYLRVDVLKKGVYGFVCYPGSLLVWDSSLTRKINLLAEMISAESGVRLFCASGVWG